MLYLAILLAYLIGAIPFGLLIGRLHGIDIRQHGSGNIGATNVLRTLGKGWGLLCFALDALKGFLPVYIVVRLAAGETSGFASVAPAIAVFATVAGHVWPIYLRFRGGKGIATSAGAVLAIAAWPVVIGLAIWLLVVFPTRYVSLASIVAAAALPVSAIVIDLAAAPPRYGLPVTILLIVLAIVTILRHRSNIRRLLNGTESKIGSKKSTHESQHSQ